ncbi:protein CHUP1, chloroplastic isoform X2 [Pyrus x bretschneideri]|uniref:protein CHUP1, chloroplastic isoform X2 n=1 Tax=Pyrus x bretschneideri TaxID=225117 RepID=UPI002030A3DB|nr:protein CHUP1, chloroplastic isoform X2 [Pyrus x bretschneideri]
MVAGKVRVAMGLQKSPANPKPETPSKSPLPSLSSGKTPQKGAVFSRSFGVYFPRSSAQVQPKPPDVTELLRLVEELRERESRLKTELLEHKLLRESVAIIPVLENEIISKNEEIDRASKRVEELAAENERLSNQVAEVTSALEEERRGKEEKLKRLEAEISELKKTTSDRMINFESDELSSSQRFQGLMEITGRSNLIRNLKRGVKCADIPTNPENQKLDGSESKREEPESERPRLSRCNSEEFAESTLATIRSRIPRVPKPPPRPSTSNGQKTQNKASTEQGIAFPPPPPPPPSQTKSALPPPPPPSKAAPPPPPPPPRGIRPATAKVKRVPEVVEFYHSLMRRDSRRESGSGVSDATGTANARDMIGEIENRSAHLLAVDERAVLKHFDWPEQKADALREAAFGYCDLKKLESEASSFPDHSRQPCGPTLKKMQALLEKLEHGVYNLSRMRDSATKRYKVFQIPTNWMLDSEFVSQIKLASVKLAMKYMKRVSAELEIVGGVPEEEELIVQGVRFAFRVHQFAGGFDAETMRAFQVLRDKVRSCHVQCQNQQQQKIVCRSTPC